jgi:hypothetical protein
MLRFIAIAAVAAATWAATPGVGPGNDGDFCGDTDLGFAGALLDTISGQGDISVSGGSSNVRSLGAVRRPRARPPVGRKGRKEREGRGKRHLGKTRFRATSARVPRSPPVPIRRMTWSLDAHFHRFRRAGRADVAEGAPGPSSTGPRQLP